MSVTYYAYCESPIGLVQISGTDSAIVAVHFVESRSEPADGHPYVQQAAAQLAEYFAGQRREFELELALAGTHFQKQVWQALLRIPYGRTMSYQELADAINNPRAVRAVGAANGQNPIAIIVPCHRVVGSNGDLTGYGGGLWRKKWLLRHEGCLLL